jgi:hypothetical protein
MMLTEDCFKKYFCASLSLPSSMFYL